MSSGKGCLVWVSGRMGYYWHAMWDDHRRDIVTSAAIAPMREVGIRMLEKALADHGRTVPARPVTWPISAGASDLREALGDQVRHAPMPDVGQRIIDAAVTHYTFERLHRARHGYPWI